MQPASGRHLVANGKTGTADREPNSALPTLTANTEAAAAQSRVVPGDSRPPSSFDFDVEDGQKPGYGTADRLAMDPLPAPEDTFPGENEPRGDRGDRDSGQGSPSDEDPFVHTLEVDDALAPEDTPEDEGDYDGADDDDRASMYSSTRPAPSVAYRVDRQDAATITSSSRSIYDDDIEYVSENGRGYYGDYMFPSDEVEQGRQYLMNIVFLRAFGLTSVALENPTHILDVGTGTGEWAMSVGEQFPRCEVTGTDIAPVQPTTVPPNVYFELDDCEIEWVRDENAYDLVHMRDMAGAVTDWDFVYLEALHCLKPGGHLEILDFHDHNNEANAFIQSFPPDAAIHTLSRAIDEASIRAGRRHGTHHLTADRLHAAGFVDVQIADRSIPLGVRAGPTARLWLVGCLHTVEAWALRPLTRYLGWAPADVRALCERVCDEIKAKALAAPSAGEGGAAGEAGEEQQPAVFIRTLTARKPTAEEAAVLRAQRRVRGRTLVGTEWEDEPVSVARPSPDELQANEPMDDVEVDK